MSFRESFSESIISQVPSSHSDFQKSSKGEDFSCVATRVAKVSAALARYHASGGFFISVLTNPTMGGVAASFASLGDLVFAEPKALIGFAGPRTIKATIRIELPEGFQTSEFLLEHGYIDRIVERFRLKTEIAAAIDYCGKQ